MYESAHSDKVSGNPNHFLHKLAHTHYGTFPIGAEDLLVRCPFSELGMPARVVCTWVGKVLYVLFREVSSVQGCPYRGSCCIFAHTHTL